MTFKHTLFFCFLLVCYSALGQDNPPTIIATGTSQYCPGGAISIADNVTITDPDVGDTTLDIVVVQVSEGYSIGEDILILTGTHPNISSNWNAAQGELTLSGNATFLEYETAIESVSFQTTQIVFTEDKFFSINIGNANYLPSTEHYYFYVADLSITWTEAEAAANATTFFGLQGYLATITSPEESQLAGEQSPGTGWIGATDAETEGTWRWVTGPEAGTIFWVGDFNGAAQNGEYAFWNNNEPNNFGGNEDYAHITDPSIGNPGSWNDLPVQGDVIGSPYHPQGYLVEFGGMPGDPVVNLSASTSLIMPRLTNINDDEGCDNEIVNLSVTSNTDTVLWYETETSTVILNNGFNFNPTLATTTTYWVVPVFNGCTDGVRSPITATINDLPVADDVTITQCEDAVVDGLTLFNINNFFGSITGGTFTNRTINYYLDAGLSQVIDGDNYINISNPQVIFAEVINTVTDCVNVAEITLEVNTDVVNNATIEACDDDSGDGIEMFVLSDADVQILAGLPVGLNVSYYSSYDDALLEQNQLPNDYQNTVPFNQTIYARVGQANSCYGIAEVMLVVNSVFPINANEEVFYCLNVFPDTIALSPEVPAGNYTYNWSTGETTSAIEINQIDMYSVEITDNNTLCSQTKVFNVLPSNIATVNFIDVMDVSQNNSITVNVEGEGEGIYEYALNINGPYQTSNIFSNLEAGEYTVYIKDVKNDCGIISRSVFVLGYPDFFTPNYDTYNDTWQIKGVPTNLQGAFKVNIYNRFGKLLYSMGSPNDSWDGTYNGVKLPTSDYWFTAFLGRGKYFSGHFTLKVN